MLFPSVGVYMLNKKEVNFVYPLIIIKFKNTKNDTLNSIR